jgi:hypothetical protein
VSRNHDFKTTIATGNVFPYDNSSELPKRHLKQVTNPEDSFLKKYMVTNIKLEEIS